MFGTDLHPGDDLSLVLVVVWGVLVVVVLMVIVVDGRPFGGPRGL